MQQPASAVPSKPGRHVHLEHPLQRLMSQLGVSSDMNPAQILQRAVALKARPVAASSAGGSAGGSDYDFDEAYFYGAPFAEGGSAWGGSSVVGTAGAYSAPSVGADGPQQQSQWTSSNVLDSGNLVHAPAQDDPNSADGSASSRARKLCPFFQQGHCKYGDFCRYSHDAAAISAGSSALEQQVSSSVVAVANFDPSVQPPSADDDDGDLCSICFEDPVATFRRYGILPACEHVFCLPCIREWRRSHGTTARGRDCPICRRTSFFVIPSFSFVRSGPAKDLLQHSYHKSMKAIPCKLFSTTGKCQFGSSCFYKHVDESGNEVAPETVRVRVGVGGVMEPSTKFSLADYIKK